MYNGGKGAKSMSIDNNCNRSRKRYLSAGFDVVSDTDETGLDFVLVQPLTGLVKVVPG